MTLKKNELPEPSHDIIKYSNKKINSLKFNFERCNKIENNYSQIYQDMFVLSMNNGTNSGTYLEIGAGDYKYGNNTYLLEYDFNWSGVSIDINIVSVEGFNKSIKFDLIQKLSLCVSQFYRNHSLHVLKQIVFRFFEEAMKLK